MTFYSVLILFTLTTVFASPEVIGSDRKHFLIFKLLEGLILINSTVGFFFTRQGLNVLFYYFSSLRSFPLRVLYPCLAVCGLCLPAHHSFTHAVPRPCLWDTTGGSTGSDIITGRRRRRYVGRHVPNHVRVGGEKHPVDKTSGWYLCGLNLRFIPTLSSFAVYDIVIIVVAPYI